MHSFSHRLAVTAPDQLPESAAADQSADIPVVPAGDPDVAASDGPDASEDVDFDAAIAEVLMTLASDKGAPVEALRIGDHAPDLDATAPSEDGDAAGLEPEDGDEQVDADDGEATLDPEAALAAEAATFRLLGELERLWHRAA